MSTLALPLNQQWYGCNPGLGIAPGPNGPSPVGLVTDAAQAANGIASASALSAADELTFATAAGPIGAVIGGLVALGFGLANVFSGCGQTCVQASNYANAAEEKLNALLNQWNSAPIHTPAMQAIYLTIVVGVFNALCQACGDGSSAGQRCINERLIQGAPAPWCPTVTGCDWVTTYYLPVANATDIVAPVQSSLPPATINPNPNPSPAPPASTGAPVTSPSVASAPAPAIMDNSLTYVVAAVVVLAFLKYRKEHR